MIHRNHVCVFIGMFQSTSSNIFSTNTNQGEYGMVQLKVCVDVLCIMIAVSLPQPTPSLLSLLHPTPSLIFLFAKSFNIDNLCVCPSETIDVIIIRVIQTWHGDCLRHENASHANYIDLDLNSKSHRSILGGTCKV